MLASPPLDSRGREVSWAAWRANRLADALAKRAAESDRVPAALRTFIRSMRTAYVHTLAILGRATFAANHRPVEDGEGGTSLTRDSTGKRPARPPRPAKRPAVDAAVAAAALPGTPERFATHPPPTHQASRKARRRAKTVEQQARAAVREAQALADWLSQRPAVQAPAGASGSDRLNALADRVRARSSTSRDD